MSHARRRGAGARPPGGVDSACSSTGQGWPAAASHAERDRRRPGWAGLPKSVCDDRCVSRRDLVHLLQALWRLSGGDPDVGVAVADVDGAIGRGHGDMRTPLNLQSLSDKGLAVRLREGTWALTPQGVAWLKQDRELSDR
jgi:hypothetical protein